MRTPYAWLKDWWLVTIPLEIRQGLHISKKQEPKPPWWIEFHSKPTLFHIRHQGGRIVATAYLNDYEEKADYEVALGLARQIIYEANAKAKENPSLPT